jgi:hypothetical protein
MDKVFVIGWQKTGTTTMTRILNDLGFRSIHTPVKLICNEWYPDGAPEEKKMNLDIDNFRSKLKCFTQEYDAFSDNPICLEQYLPVIANEYPEAAFIYTSREIKPWLKSAFFHLHSSRTYNIFRKRLELYTDYTPKNGIYTSNDPLGLCEYVYQNSYPYITKNDLIESYKKHRETVYYLFRGRSNFLEIDFSDNVDVHKISSFLGLKNKQIQDIPYLNMRNKSLVETIKTNIRSVAKKLIW